MDLKPTQLSDVMLGAGIEAIYAGVDWISCTLSGEVADMEWWILRCDRELKEIAKEGYDLEAYSRNGYDGYGVGGCFLGRRHDGAYLQLSGHHAGDVLDRIHHNDLHISRLDLQTTVRYRVEAKGIGRVAYQRAIDANETLQHNRRRKIWYMAGNDGGWTTYIGAPTSEQRAKLYNKAIQSSKPEYERCWRWEVTAKNEYATAWYRQVSAEKDKRPSLCARMVASWFALRGCDAEWSTYIPLITLPLIKEAPSDADKRLRWLREQVRPAVAWLCANGLEREARDALDL